jgi:chromate transporter
MESVTPTPDPVGIPPVAAPVALSQIFKVFLMAGAVSFGGGVVAYLREYLVRASHWLSDEEFMSALEISETLPGLNSVNIAVITGDDLRGVPGAVAAVVGLMLPGVVFVMMLGILWTESRHNPLVSHFLLGIASAAVGLLLVVSLQLGRLQLVKLPDLLIVMVTFVAVSILKISLAYVLIGVGTVSIWLYRPHSAREAAPEQLPFHRGPRHNQYRR